MVINFWLKLFACYLLTMFVSVMLTNFRFELTQTAEIFYYFQFQDEKECLDSRIQNQRK